MLFLENVRVFFINFTFLILTDPLFELSFDYQVIWDHFEPWQEVRRRLKCIFEREPPDWSRSSNVGSIFPGQWIQLRPQTQFSEVFKIGDLISAAACNRSGQEFVGISGKATNIFTPAEIELETHLREIQKYIRIWFFHIKRVVCIGWMNCIESFLWSGLILQEKRKCRAHHGR